MGIADESMKMVAESVPRTGSAGASGKDAGGVGNHPVPSRTKTLGKRSLARQLPEITLPRMHEEYLRSRRVENVRESTLLLTYERALQPWAAWCADHGVILVGHIQTSHAEEYLLSLMARKLSERTVRNRAVVIKSALKFAHKRNYLASERMYAWKIPKMERANVYMPELAEVGAILSAIPDHWAVAENLHSRFRNAAARAFFARRDQAVVAVQVSTGLRISETFALRLHDYSEEHKPLTVTHSKTGKPRAVPVGAALAQFLADWLRERPAASPIDFLFVTEYGQQLHGPPWGRQFQRYISFARGRGSALPHITLHSLRHLAGTAMAERDLHHASLILGHSSIKVTADNYLYARAEKIRATHEAADPLAQIVSRGRRALEKCNQLV